MKINTAALASYARSFLAVAITAIVSLGKSPIDFSSSDWKHAANAVWIAAIPVIMRAVNPKDTLTITK
jgi:hypothetical protein